MESHQTIADCFDNCEFAFESLLNALQTPVRDFGALITQSFVRDERGRYRVWARTVGAHHLPTSRLSLEYRLRESEFYLEQNFRLLRDLHSALGNGKPK
jgi:hypothetical protein